MKAIEQNIIRFISENNLISQDDRILVALSGGPDSILLLHFLNKYKTKYKIKLGAAHVNHLLRDQDSERDELFCRTVCNELKVPFYNLRKNVKQISKRNKNSVEVTGRKIRYKFFNEVCNKDDFTKIATAHNSDDNVETVFLNIIKGAGLKGISGIPVQRDNIIRPILCLSKEDVYEYLNENRFEYRVDQSNFSNRYERNYLRNEIIPLVKNELNPALNSVVLNSSIILQSLIQELEEGTSEIQNKLTSNINKYLSIPISVLGNKNRFLSSYIIKNKLENNFNIKAESIDIKKIFAIADKHSGKSEELSNNLILLRERNLILIKKKENLDKTISQKIKIGETKKIGEKLLSIKRIKMNSIQISKTTNTEFIDAEKVNNEFVIRSWREGDKFKPFGMKGTKKISDYLNDLKVNSFNKKNQLVLENENKIVWIIGKRLDDQFKITNYTKKAIKLCLK